MEDKIRKAFAHVKMDETMERRILAEVKKKERPKRKMPQAFKRGVVIAAVAMVIFGSTQIPEISVYGKQLAETFKNVFYAEDGQEFTMVGSYAQIRSDSPKKGKTFDSLNAIEEATGLSLLKSDMAAETKNCWQYHPMALDDGSIIEILLTNRFYILGDLEMKNRKNQGEDPTANPEIFYKKGENFKTPINMQLLVRVENDSHTAKDNLPDYDGSEMALAEDADAEKYFSKALNTEVLIYRLPSDGLAVWNDYEVSAMTFAQFSHENVEYHLCGDVDRQTMKNMIEEMHP